MAQRSLTSMRLLLYLLGLTLLVRSVYADRTLCSIHNFTPYKFTIISNGVIAAGKDVRWMFPNSIKSGTSEEAEVNIDDTVKSAKVTYSVASEDGKTVIGSFDIWVDVSKQNPTLYTRLNGFSAGGYPAGQTFELGFFTDDGEKTPFILSGGQYGTGFATTFPHESWLQDNLQALGCRTLRELCMPGSHDSGMSEFNHPSSPIVPDYLTKTQTVDVFDQLRSGVRYFDIRPTIDGSHYVTGHFTGDLGANGQSMQDVIWNINNFTNSNAELIVLRFASSVNRDRQFLTFDQKDWDGLMRWTNEINHLWKEPCTGSCDLTTKTLNDFIKKGEAAVILINLDGNHDFRGNPGWYEPKNFPIFGSFSNTINRNFMVTDQREKLAENRKKPTDAIFELLWTLTVNVNPNGIISWADGIFTDLFTADGNSQNGLPTGTVDVDPSNPFNNDQVPILQGILRWTTPQSYPNIITLDSVRADRRRLVTSLAIGINRLYATCPKSNGDPMSSNIPASSKIPASSNTPASSKTPAPANAPASSNTPLSNNTPAPTNTLASSKTPAFNNGPAVSSPTASNSQTGWQVWQSPTYSYKPASSKDPASSHTPAPFNLPVPSIAPVSSNSQAPTSTQTGWHVWQNRRR